MCCCVRGNTIGRLKKLRKLSLENCGGIGDAEIAEFVDAGLDLNELNINNTKVSDEGLMRLKEMRGINALDLSYCKNLIGKDLRMLSNWHDLCALKMRVNLHNYYKVQIGECELSNNLERLELSGICVDMAAIGAIRCRKLRNLILSSCRIDDEGLSKLIGLDLEELRLDGNMKITNRGLKVVSGMKNLKILDVRECMMINDEGFNYLMDLVKLELLGISANKKNITDKYVRDKLNKIYNLFSLYIY